MSFFFPSFCLPLLLYSSSDIFILDALLIYHRIETEKTVNIFFYLKNKSITRVISSTRLSLRVVWKINSVNIVEKGKYNTSRSTKP